MNYQEAKEIRYKISHGDLRMDDFIAGESKGYLGGYLEAHAKAQKLVEALEGLIQAATDFDCQICGNGTCHDTCARYQAEEILKEWHKENKEGE